jgi:hypothetical protein
VRRQFSAEMVEGLLLNQIRLYYREEAIWQDLGVSGRGELLGDALERDHERRLFQIFDLLDLLYPDRDVQLIREAMREASLTARANAVELLEIILEPEIRYLLVPVMEGETERLLEIGKNVFGIVRCSFEERLAELAAESDSWLRSCALYQIGLLGLESLQAEVEEANYCEDPLVRETSLVAGRAMLDSERFVALAKDYAQNDPDPQVRRYAHSLFGNDRQGNTRTGP